MNNKIGSNAYSNILKIKIRYLLNIRLIND